MMSLTLEQAESIKEQLRNQVQKLPEEQKEQALAQIDSMSDEAVELLVKQQQEKMKKSVFRMIISKEIKSVIADETEFYLAVFEINPISKGHVIVIPKNPVSSEQEIPESILESAKKLAEKLSHYLKAKSAEVVSELKFGEKVLNIIPVYDAPLNLSSPRSSVSLEELEKLASSLKEAEEAEKKAEAEQRAKSEKKEAPAKPQVLKLKRRIP